MYERVFLSTIQVETLNGAAITGSFAFSSWIKFPSYNDYNILFGEQTQNTYQIEFFMVCYLLVF